MSAGAWFVAGMGTAVVGTIIVAKVMKPQIVRGASEVAMESFVRFGQNNGLNLAALGVNPAVIRDQLIAPAISTAMERVWL